jgi:predicted chitinase
MQPEELPTLRLRDGIDSPNLAPFVSKLQAALGIPAAEIDGKFGKQTQALVIQFQERNGLVADGVVGRNTWSALLKKPVKSAPPPPRQPPENTRYIEIGGRRLEFDRILKSIPYPDIRAAATRSLPLILRECLTCRVTNPAQIAYILATAEHESHLGNWMEEFASGWEYEGWEELGNTQPGDGPRFKGRGFVQLTGRANYTDWSQRLKLDLLSAPEQVSQPSIAAKILVLGMRDGTFTGYRLNDFLGDDFYQARRIINHLDRASQIAAIAEEYLKVL